MRYFNRKTIVTRSVLSAALGLGLTTLAAAHFFGPPEFYADAGDHAQVAQYCEGVGPFNEADTVFGLSPELRFYTSKSQCTIVEGKDFCSIYVLETLASGTSCIGPFTARRPLYGSTIGTPASAAGETILLHTPQGRIEIHPDR